MLLKIENLFIKSQCSENWIRFHKPENSCCISWTTVPAVCAVSFFLVPFFLLGGTPEEWPTNNDRQKTLSHWQKRILHWTQHDFINHNRKSLYVYYRKLLKSLYKNSMFWELDKVSQKSILLLHFMDYGTCWLRSLILFCSFFPFEWNTCRMAYQQWQTKDVNP